LLTPRLPVLFAIATPLLLPLLVSQPGTSLDVLVALAAPLLLSLLVCQPGTGLGLVLTVASPAPGLKEKDPFCLCLKNLSFFL
jgi:hypothetical protein